MFRRNALHRLAIAAAACLIAAAFASCRQGMYNQPKYEPYEESDFFDDRRSARPLIEGTIARGYLREDDHLYRGRVGGQPAESFPFPIGEDVLKRGRERYDIFCAACHGFTGTGDGMIVQRGFPPPPSFHDDRLRKAAPGHYFDVMTNGFGTMYSYATRVSVEDRWAIAAYIRALQYSQNAPAAALPPNVRKDLEDAHVATK